MATTEDLLQREIALLAEQIRKKKSALASLQQANALAMRAEKPFIQMRPNKAVAEILKSAGIPLPISELLKRAAEGGATYGKKRGEHNVRIAIEMGLGSGKLKLRSDLVGLPEWPDELFRND